MIFDLNASTFKELCTFWLCPKDILALDSSVYSHKMRSSFLFLLQKQNAYFESLNTIQFFAKNSDFLVWLMKRKIQIRRWIVREWNINAENFFIASNYTENHRKLGCDCSLLVHLNLGYCGRLNNDALYFISQSCRSLHTLFLTGNTECTDAGVMVMVKSNTQLTFLDLQHTLHLSKDSIVAALTHCVRLKTLNINGCGANMTEALSEISNKLIGQYLQTLIIGICPSFTYTDNVINAIGRSSLHSLTELDTQNATGVQMESMQLLFAHCSMLKTLDFSYFRFGGYSNESCISILSLTSNLRQVRLSKCYQINDVVLNAIGTYCTKLTTIFLDKCCLITDSGLSAMMTNCLELQDINLMFCDLITDEGLSQIARNCRNLTYLNLFKCRLSTDIGVAELAENCRFLRGLNLNGCPQVSGEGIARIGLHCKLLSELYIQDSIGITDANILTIAEHCKHLQVIKMRSAGSISSISIRSLVRNCTLLRVLDANSSQLGRTVKRWIRAMEAGEPYDREFLCRDETRLGITNL